jgi:hypothetical protein
MNLAHELEFFTSLSSFLLNYFVGRNISRFQVLLGTRIVSSFREGAHMRTTKESYSSFIHFLTPSASYVSRYALLQIYIIILSVSIPACGVKVVIFLCDIECKRFT